MPPAAGMPLALIHAAGLPSMLPQAGARVDQPAVAEPPSWLT